MKYNLLVGGLEKDVVAIYLYNIILKISNVYYIIYILYIYILYYFYDCMKAIKLIELVCFLKSDAILQQ